MFNEPRGISRTGDIIDLGVEHGVLTKSGAFYSFGDQRIGQGRENAKQFLADNPDLAQQIEDDIRRETGLPAAASPALDDEPVAVAGR
jgi:recombination protein RecA